MSKIAGKRLLKIYGLLHKHFGPRHWWPADTPFEVMVGAILTQNTSWKNVEKAVLNLKKNNLLTPKALHRLDASVLKKMIKPAGFFNVKAGRLKNFVDFIVSKYNNIQRMLSRPQAALRQELLGVNGIGPETADSILLYAAGKPVFVIDAYTKRIFSRHGLAGEDAEYGELQKFFMDNLPRKASLFNEYHALLVELGKTYCRKKPLCENCPLNGIKK